MRSIARTTFVVAFAGVAGCQPRFGFDVMNHSSTAIHVEARPLNVDDVPSNRFGLSLDVRADIASGARLRWREEWIPNNADVMKLLVSRQAGAAEEARREFELNPRGVVVFVVLDDNATGLRIESVEAEAD